MRDQSLSSVFKTVHDNDPVTVAHALEWFKEKLGYQESREKKFIIHDLFHLLGNVTSGALKEERIVGIIEHQMITTPLFNGEVIGDHFRRYEPLSEPLLSAAQIGERYVQNGRIAIRAQKEWERHQLRSYFIASQAPESEFDLIINSHPTIQKLEKILSSESALTSEEFSDAERRGGILNRYFMMIHNGRKLDTYPISMILNMPLSEFGIIPVIKGDTVEFDLLPHLAAEFKPWEARELVYD